MLDDEQRAKIIDFGTIQKIGNKSSHNMGTVIY